jgi:AraC-like DNA-binding protein
MQNWEIFILVFSGLGIFNSLAFILYISFFGRAKSIISIFIKILLAAFILQITHALIELFELNTFPYLSNIYLIGAYSIGPSIYLYVRKSINSELKIWPGLFIVHYLPYIIISLIKYDFVNTGAKEWFAIYLVGIQYLFYILISIKPYRKLLSEYRKGAKEHFVITYLYPVYAILWLYYPLSELTKTNYQVWETFLHSTLVYYLMYLLIKAPKSSKDKYKFSDISKDRSKEIYEMIIQRIEENEYYLDPDITSTKISRKLNLPINTFSQAINQNTNSNFRDFINFFRIQKAKETIILKTQKGFTISSIAFDCGFNSLSAFNRAFKKATNTTPTEYIKQKSTDIND